LRNADGFFGKSDPYVKVMGLTGANVEWGATKTVRDNLNPTFNESFTIDLMNKYPLGGALKPLVLEIWDEDNKKRSSSDDPLGKAILPWTSTFPDLDAPPLGSLKLEGKGAKSGSTISASISMRQIDLGNIGRSLLQNAISGVPVANNNGAAAAVTGAMSNMDFSDQPKTIRIEKSACKANLAKGLGFKIADCTDNIADKYTMGLAWDVTNGQNIDLDASCVWLDAMLRPIDTVISNSR
jgi:hypothetical protein